MKVCKFGGSSLANASQIAKVIDIVLADPSRRIVVVSAPGRRFPGDVKTTDMLIDMARKALAGEDTSRIFGEIVERYASIADELRLGEETTAAVEADLRKRLAARGTISDEAFSDLVKAAGEDNCAKVVAAAFCARGRKARYASPRDTGMVLKGGFGDAVLDESSYATLSRAFSDFDGIVIYPGFFGYTREGLVATFPRGGSDITGSILAAAVRADVYENFTDVDSVYPVDPSIVPEVVATGGIDTMTYREMRELAYAGFGVFADEAVIPAVRARIPINIRNTNRPEEPGTMIVQSRRVVPGTLVGVAALDGFCNVMVEKYMMNREIGFGRRLLQIVENEGVPYEHVPSGVDSQCVILKECNLTKEKERRIVQAVRRELAPDLVAVQHDMTILMAVGEGMCFTSGMLGRICGALSTASVSVSMLNSGSSETSVMLSISPKDRDVAVRALYREFFTNDAKGR